jgi:hypothetical protein
MEAFFDALFTGVLPSFESIHSGSAYLDCLALERSTVHNQTGYIRAPVLSSKHGVSFIRISARIFAIPADFIWALEAADTQ